MRYFIAALAFLLLTAFPLSADVRIASIEVSGNHRTYTRIIMNYLYFDEGDMMSHEELEERIARSRTRLLNTRYFSSVEIKAVYEDADSININITIEEGFLWRLNGGTWFVQIGRDNLFGRGVNGALHLSRKTQSIILNSPYFRGSPFLVRAWATHQVVNRDIIFVDPEENFDYERYGISGSVGYNFNPDISFELNAAMYSFELEDKDFRAETLFFLGDNGVSGRTQDTDLGFSFRVDRRGDRLIPTDGYFLNGGIMLRDGVPGLNLQLLNYREMTEKTYLFSRFSLTSFGDQLPYHLWRSLGGIRGLKFPESGDQIGRSTLLLSIEPRYRFIEVPSYNSFLEARVFFDTGVAYLEAADFSFDRFVSGYGFGLRLWVGYPYYQNAVLYYGFRDGEGQVFFRFGSSF